MPNFTEFNLNPIPAGNDFIVGYTSDGSAEYRATAQSLATALSSATVISLSTTAPNNNVAARIGTIGIDPNNNVWIKETGTGTSGWESIFTSTSGAYYANIILQDATGVVLNLGELGRVESTLVMGDGSTAGGNPVGSGPVTSTYTFVSATRSIQPISGSNIASGNWSNVAGGQCNIAGGVHSNVGGGCCNTACARVMDPGDSQSTIGGGIGNRATGSYSTIAGGIYNTACGFNDTVAGGICNTACSLGFFTGGATIGGGACNTASGNYSFIAGGANNNTRNFANTFILGSSLSAAQANYTYVNNLSSQGTANVNNLTVTGVLSTINVPVNITGTAAGNRYSLNLTNLNDFDPGQPLTVDGRARIVHGMTFQAGITNFTNGSDHTHVQWAAQGRNAWQMIQNGGSSSTNNNIFALHTVGFNTTTTFFNESNIYNIDTTGAVVGTSPTFTLSGVKISYNTDATPRLSAGQFISISLNPGAVGIVANTYSGVVSTGPNAVIIGGSTRQQYTFTIDTLASSNWVAASKGSELVYTNAAGNKNVRVSFSPQTIAGTQVSLTGNYRNIPRYVLVNITGHNAYEGQTAALIITGTAKVNIPVGNWTGYIKEVIDANNFVFALGTNETGYVDTTSGTTGATGWYIIKGSIDSVHKFTPALQQFYFQRFSTLDNTTSATGGNRAVALGNSADVDGNFSYALGYKSAVFADRAAVLGGENNYVTGSFSSILGGRNNTASSQHSIVAGGSANDTRGFNNTFILGSSLSATVANFTYVNNLSSQGVVVANPLRVGNSVSATGPVGTITGKVEVFNAAGSSLGFIPIYNTIT